MLVHVSMQMRMFSFRKNDGTCNDKLQLVDMFPQTGDFWICFRKQGKRSKSVDMFPYTDDINLIATRHVECVVLLSKHS